MILGRKIILAVFRLEIEETHDEVCSKRKRENRDRSHDKRHGKKLVVLGFDIILLQILAFS